MDILSGSEAVLMEAGFVTRTAHISGRPVLLIEGETVLGFIFAYASTDELADRWQKESTAAIAENQFGLRLAGHKAWNTYVILLCTGSTNTSGEARLAGIEEDLSGTRKIARAGVSDTTALTEALLPLLPLRAAPRLTAVDIEEEIRQRTTELPSRAVQGFLTKADAAIVLQVLEEAP